MAGPLIRSRRTQSDSPAPGARAAALIALAFATIFWATVAIAAWVYHSQAPGVDFASFWAAGHLVLSGTAELAYDAAAHRAVEETVANMGGLLPFSYPPPFLLFVAPFAFRPFWAAYLLWMLVTTGLYYLASRPLMPARFAFAHPAGLINAVIGQNGFLTAGIFLAGTALLAAHPFAGGAVLGLLAIKPQLACLIPVAFVAGREWRALAGMAAASLFLLGLAALAFGTDSYGAFLASGREFAGLVSDKRWNWPELASVFAFARSLGVHQNAALALQAVAAVGAVFVTWRSWTLKRRERVAVLAAATMLVPPYLFTYDSLLLIVPLAWFLREDARPWRAGALWILLLLPLGGYFDLYTGPNTVPLAAILSLWWLRPSRERKLEVRTGGALADSA